MGTRRVKVGDLKIGGIYSLTNSSSKWELLEKRVGESYTDVKKGYLWPDRIYWTTFRNDGILTEHVDGVKKKEEKEMANELFQLKGTDIYGYKLATNSQGKIVFEVKSTGEVRAVDRGELEEVIPYTVDITFVGGSSAAYSYFAKEGDVKVGDVIFIENTRSLAVVKKVNTRSKKATEWLTGSVLSVAKTLEGE